jgi:hypothetical protein
MTQYQFSLFDGSTGSSRSRIAVDINSAMAGSFTNSRPTKPFSHYIDVKIFKMSLFGIPQERIESRLGIDQSVIKNHLLKTSELKKTINDQSKRGFSINAIATKEGWPEPLVWAVVLEGKIKLQISENGKMQRPESIQDYNLWELGTTSRQIGEASGVNASTVMRDVNSVVANATPATVKGKDGKEYPATKPKAQPPKLLQLA